MKPSDEFATIVAGIVTADTFQLLNASGDIVAELATEPAFTDFTGGASLEMRHLDATIVDSALAWTQNNPDGTTQQVVLKGPSEVGITDAPALLLERVGIGINDISRARLRSGRPSLVTSPVAQVDTFTDVMGDATVRTLATSSGFTSSALIESQATGPGGVALMQLDGGTGDIEVSAAVTARLRGTTSAVVRQGPAGPYVQAVAGGINLNGPNVNHQVTGRVQLNGKNTLQLLSYQEYVMPASLSLPYRSFLMNGINPPNAGVVGDIYEINATCRVLCIVAAGAFLAEYQGFGGGAGVSAQRIVATQWAANHDATLSASWRFEQTVAGAVGWTIVGGQTGGTWQIVAPDSWFTVKHWGIR